MMWHWNSMWARAPGDPPTLTDPVLWQSPWSAEALALQARTWEAMLSTTHSWWSTMLAAWPMGTAWVAPAWALPTADGAATAAAEPLAAELPAPAAASATKKTAAPRKRTASRATSARKR